MEGWWWYYVGGLWRDDVLAVLALESIIHSITIIVNKINSSYNSIYILTATNNTGPGIGPRVDGREYAGLRY
jgi:hypothetical protein